MSYNYAKEFKNFVEEVKSLNGAENAKFYLPNNSSNIVLISGELTIKKLNIEIRNIGRKHHLSVMADELTIPIV